MSCWRPTFRPARTAGPPGRECRRRRRTGVRFPPAGLVTADAEASTGATLPPRTRRTRNGGAPSSWSASASARSATTRTARPSTSPLRDAAGGLPETEARPRAEIDAQPRETTSCPVTQPVVPPAHGSPLADALTRVIGWLNGGQPVPAGEGTRPRPGLAPYPVRRRTGRDLPSRPVPRGQRHLGDHRGRRRRIRQLYHDHRHRPGHRPAPPA